MQCRIKSLPEALFELCARRLWTCLGMWRLAKGVVLAQVKKGSGDVIEYAIAYDATNVCLRKASDRVGPPEELLACLHNVVLHRDADPPIRMFHLSGEPIRLAGVQNVKPVLIFESAIDRASALLRLKSGGELDWLAKPEKI